MAARDDLDPELVLLAIVREDGAVQEKVTRWRR